ncbi:MAG: hypothetical protein BRD41_04310 [Bacteroidetes bacterium QS_1_63_11]|nr:MAG: hypothetical protein BRD41_04310 [Bacteroidetes bacterium QS_1_63_11]
MIATCRVLVLLAGGLAAFGTGLAFGQAIDVGGRAFVDYYSVVSTPDAAQEDLSHPLSVADTARDGLHGFTYRRLYLTTDFRLSRTLEGRARLEANEGSSGPNGPMPFVKDLYVTWQYNGDHSATIGVTEPPVFEVSTDMWGYRSLEQTILDRRGIASSRDFGLRLDGPLLAAGHVRYAVMYANNNSTNPETDPYKRGYGRLSATPTDRLTLVAGADYTAHQDQREYSVRGSAFVGYEARRVRVGLEGYGRTTALTDTTTTDEFGASLFGVLQVARSWEVVGRLDWSTELRPQSGPASGLGFDPVESLLLAGVAYRPTPNVALTPNVWIRNSNRFSESDTLLRLTLDLSF